jgi:O-antigen biosynthesis protein WbqV
VIQTLENLDWRSFLGRPAMPMPQQEVLDGLCDAPILITGAGGSIGSALARRLGTLGLQRLVLLEASESNLYALERDWAAALAAHARSATPRTPSMTPILGSVADEPLLQEVFAMHQPRIVFHAAAFKHVPLMEEHPLAAIANNIFATETLTQVAAERNARVILLSTDKAVEPASVMGATKRVAEQIVLAAGGTVLRLGNVLASRDSVTEIFERQIAQGGPVTVTDPAARRYFLTLDEAVNLLLAAALVEPAALLAPSLTATHFIADLARFMACELAPGRDIAIEFTKPRPGDKETELLWSAGDQTLPAGGSGLVSIKAELHSRQQLDAGLAGLRAALDARDLADALAALRALVPDYTPSAAVLALSRQNSPQVTR